MRLYRDVWITTAGVAMTVGMWAAFAIGTIPGVLGLFISFAVLGLLVALLQQPDDRPPQHGRAVLYGALGSASLISTGGLVAAFGPAVLWLVVAAVVACPWLLRRGAVVLGKHLPAPKAPAGPAAPADADGHNDPEPAEPPGPSSVATIEVSSSARADGLDDLALCMAWRRSFIALERSHTLMARMCVVQQRQLYLDELERRNPTGLSAWLESGARAAGDPSRYIIHGPSDQSGQRAHGPKQSDR